MSESSARPRRLTPDWYDRELTFQAFIFSFLVSITAYLFIFVEAYVNDFHKQIISIVLLATLFLLYKMDIFTKAPWRIFLLFIGGFISLRYIFWRAFDTLIYTNFADFLAMSILFLAEVHALILHLLSMFVNIWPLEHAEAPLPDNPDDYPSVDILIPTYTEEEDIVEVTARAAKNIDYPEDKLNVYICDDGATAARRNNPKTSSEAWKRHYNLRRIAEKIGVRYITREKNERAKAGNLNHALNYSQGDLVLVLDCDHVPTSDILKRTAGYFLIDPKLYLVQTPHFFINPTPIEKNLAGIANIPVENDMFFKIIHTGLDSWNSSYFCGSAALLRRKMLSEIGGIAGITITEDAETSLELHRRGYNSVYVNRPMVCGLSPETFSGYVTQRSRWAQGMVQLLILNNVLFSKGLRFSQRLCYFNSSFFWFFGLSRFVFYMAPASFLLLNLKVYHASVQQILIYALPHILGSWMIMDFLYRRAREPLFSHIYESVQSLFLMPAILSVIINPLKPSFKITEKGSRVETDYLNPLASSFLILVFVNLIALFIAVEKWFSHPLHRDVILVTGVWCGFNVLMSLISLGAFWEKKQVRKHHRIDTDGKASVYFHRLGETVTGEVENISLKGIGMKLDLPFKVPLNDDIDICVEDSCGREYKFRAKIRRVSKSPGIASCGTEFMEEGDWYMNAIEYVYGDSQRWTNHWEKKQGSGKGLYRILMVFLRMGVFGAVECSWGIAKGFLIYGKQAVASAVRNRFAGKRKEGFETP